MRSEQDELRRRRDVSLSLSLSLSPISTFFLPLQSCYRLSHDLKDREVKIKDKMSELRAALDNAREKKREVSAQKDSISKGRTAQIPSLGK